MNRRDDLIRHLQESALHRVSRQRLSAPARGMRAKKRVSKAQLFVQLVEQFVDQVARIDEPREEEDEKEEEDNDVILIDPKTSEPISNGGLEVAERRVQIRGIPNRAASRVAEVLKNEFGIVDFEAKRYREDGDETRSLLNEDDGQRKDRVSDLQDQPLHAISPASSAPSSARAESSDEIEIIEVDEKLNGTSLLASLLREDNSKDRQTSDGNAANTLRVLATTRKDSAPANIATAATENQLPTTSSTAVQYSPIHIAASQPVPVRTKPVNRAQLFTMYQLTPVRPQTSSPSVIRKLVKPTLLELARSSSPLAPPTPSSADVQPEEQETTGSESACCYSIGDITGSDPELNESASTNQESNPLVQSSIASQHSKPVVNHFGKPRKSWALTSQKDASNQLSAEVIDSIHQNSLSITNFAVNLMRSLFDMSEIMACKNLFWRAKIFPASEFSDVKRIHLIHRLVQEKAGPEYSTELWDRCVGSMRTTIYQMRQIHMRDIRLGRIGNDDEAQGLLFPKQSDDLKESEFYAQNNISFKKINSLYNQSRSNPNFAKNLMLLLFDKSELLECLNVLGRNPDKTVTPDRALDPRRIQTIKHIVEENSNFSAELWSHCVHTMNHKISLLKRSIKS